METVIFGILSILLVIGFLHEDWFVAKEQFILQYICRKILRLCAKYGKLKVDLNKEKYHESSVKSIQRVRNSVRQQS